MARTNYRRSYSVPPEELYRGLVDALYQERFSIRKADERELTCVARSGFRFNRGPFGHNPIEIVGKVLATSGGAEVCISWRSSMAPFFLSLESAVRPTIEKLYSAIDASTRENKELSRFKAITPQGLSVRLEKIAMLTTTGVLSKAEREKAIAKLVGDIRANGVISEMEFDYLEALSPFVDSEALSFGDIQHIKNAIVEEE